MTDVERAEVYDDLFKKADDLFKKYNPCKVRNNECARGNPCCTSYDFISDEPRHCTHLKLPQGCQIKSLTCRLWLCGITYDLEVNPEYTDFLIELRKLKKLSQKYSFPIFRGTKQQSLERSKMYEIQEANYHIHT